MVHTMCCLKCPLLGFCMTSSNRMAGNSHLSWDGSQICPGSIISGCAHKEAPSSSIQECKVKDICCVMGESAGVYESCSSQMAMRCTASTPSAPARSLLSEYSLPKQYKTLEETVFQNRVKMLQCKLGVTAAAETRPSTTYYMHNSL